MRNHRPSRRRWLQLGGTALVVSLAGCLSQLSGDADTDSENETDPALNSEADPVSDKRVNTVSRETFNSVVLIETDEESGTGFMFDDEHVVTNAHVVGEASQVEIRFSEGRWTTGEVVGSDRHSDLAAIAIETVPESATPLSFIEGRTEVGMDVVAIGNPFNFDGSVTEGIVSLVNRSSIPSSRWAPTNTAIWPSPSRM